ncbi:hypothetical protein QAD02_002105 [Eretmocerus hayati]|uniref:Uncharacterized protein n=1 Tax=Eretmocerus hayati TaxID=131215 RepID=A0ACC2NIU5_9HYME|nr:hypothetical protein QAD02_002105 [Eretmocerus hayati]
MNLILYMDEYDDVDAEVVALQNADEAELNFEGDKIQGVRAAPSGQRSVERADSSFGGSSALDDSNVTWITWMSHCPRVGGYPVTHPIPVIRASQVSLRHTYKIVENELFLNELITKLYDVTVTICGRLLSYLGGFSRLSWVIRMVFVWLMR